MKKYWAKISTTVSLDNRRHQLIDEEQEREKFYEHGEDYDERFLLEWTPMVELTDVRNQDKQIESMNQANWEKNAALEAANKRIAKLEADNNRIRNDKVLIHATDMGNRDKIKDLESKIKIAVEALEYYSFKENHFTQTVFNKEKRCDEQGSAVMFCDDCGKRAREALAQIKDA